MDDEVEKNQWLLAIKSWVKPRRTLCYSCSKSLQGEAGWGVWSCHSLKNITEKYRGCRCVKTLSIQSQSSLKMSGMTFYVMAAEIKWQPQRGETSWVLIAGDQRKGGTSGACGTPGGRTSSSSGGPTPSHGCPSTAYRNHVINTKLLHIWGVWIIFPLWHNLRTYYLVFDCSLASACSSFATLFFLNYLPPISQA